MGKEIIPQKEYQTFLEEVKSKIKQASYSAALSANKSILILYWDIGKSILNKQKKEGWGSKVVDRLSIDLNFSFPKMKGFSRRNLIYMRKFAEAYPEFVQVPLAQIKSESAYNLIVQEPLAQLPWYHHITLLEKVKNKKEREWYILKTIENGWSRNILVNQIESGLIKRTGKAISNFKNTLPSPMSELAQQTLKDPYIIDAFGLSENVKEIEFENYLVKNISKLLLELGKGFAFIGNQYKLTVNNKLFELDLLFYNYKLHCFFVVDLKIGDFLPEYAGKMNFYLSAVDSILKSKEDNPSIGLILCKFRDKIIAEYSVRDMTKPIGIAEYEFLKNLPPKIKSALPSVKEIESELSSFIKSQINPAGDGI
jgi:predicted nuclease of restriction endonuclease-like (RecB) superfamily